MRLLLLCLLLLPLSSYAAWKYSDKKTPEQSIEIATEQGELLKAYVWLPKDYDPDRQYKAVVMAHGCGGAHYKDDPSKWTARYISGKYKVWGKLFNDQNMIALLVDSFSTRDVGGDVGGGVCHSADALIRPAKIDPISVRPSDIAHAIAYLKSRDDVQLDKVGVMGFSNGATSTLVLANHQHLEERADELISQGKVWFDLPFIPEFRANVFVSMYPGCGLNGYAWETKNIFTSFETYTNTFLFIASNDRSLPDNTKEKCQRLSVLDANKSYLYPNMLMEVIANTDHQFDYKENKEAPVIKNRQRILALFDSM